MKNYPYLNDIDFLAKISGQKIQEQFINIIVLSWDEIPIQAIEGKATGGSINFNGDSAMRRTASVSMVADLEDSKISNVRNLISINKKISLELGLKNFTNQYTEYDIIWLPMGVYVITDCSISNSSGGITISIQLKDKMCLLNGECGGTLPAAVVFDKIETLDENGNIVISSPTIYQIITEAVSELGGEQPARILISDIDSRIKKVMRWIGSSPLYLFNEGNGYEFTISTSKINSLIEQGYTEVYDFSLLPNEASTNYIKYTTGQDIGFMYTDFIYTGGDFVENAGSTVYNVLTKITDFLGGNYEFFYDVEGNFIFREIKNYLNTSYTNSILKEIDKSNYLISHNNNKTVFSFKDYPMIISYDNHPQYNMIKNDFIVWGEAKNGQDKTRLVRYHLAIDTKPPIGITHRVFKYLDPDDGIEKAKATLNFTSIDSFPSEGKIGIFYYSETEDAIYQWNNSKSNYILVKDGKLVDVTSTDWRTELYLQGVEAEVLGQDSNYYYTELQNEWPRIFNIWGDSPDFYEDYLKNPSLCTYFLDFIDSQSAVGELNVNNIGRRSQVITNNEINCIFAPTIPDLILLESDSADIAEKRIECEQRGDKFVQVDRNIFALLAGGGQLNPAYDAIRELLYQYTSYNSSISISTIPVYFLDVNNLIEVEDDASDIHGNFIVNSFSIPLDISSNMTISASQALERI